MRNERTLHATCALVLTASMPAMAADVPTQNDYPRKTIRVLVGQSPGGAIDIIARNLAQELIKSMGQSVVIDNRTGAAGSIAASLAARAPADGYTALFISSSYTINAVVDKNLLFNPDKDLQPVTLIATAPFILLTHPSVPAKSVKDLIALAKAKPNQLNYGSGGIGSSGHLAAVLFSSMAGITITHIPYKGVGAAFTDVIGGQLQMIFTSIVAGMPYAKGPRLNALAVTSLERSAVLPELPTVAESGLPGYDYALWFGLLVPTGTPRPIIAKLNAEVVRVINQPDFKEKILNDGAQPVGSSVERFGAYLKADFANWTKVVKSTGMTLE